jgi:hypothetical protein
MAAALGVCVGIAVSFWRRRRELIARQAWDRPGLGAGRFELAQTPFASGNLDVAAEIRLVLAELDAVAARQFAELEMAAPPDLFVRCDPRAFREMLSEIIGNAIRQAPCSKVLVGAMRHGGRIQITVTDDGMPRTEAVEGAALRRASELAALHGATLNHEVRIESTTTVLRLPDALPARPAPPAIVPAKQQATSAAAASDITVNPAE